MSSMEMSSSDSHRYTVQVKGPHDTEKDGHQERLLTQLEKIPRDIQLLQITKDTPSNIEWELLGNHFNRIKDLEMHTGYNENLNDAELPAHWPLERLFVTDACGELVCSPFVLEGRVKHLVLLATCGLRFEGPTNDELDRAHDEAIARGEKEATYITLNEGSPEESQIELVYLSDLVQDSMEMSTGPRQTSLSALKEGKGPVQTKMVKLEILHNDSIDTFNRMTIALPHVVESLSTVNIYSIRGRDSHSTGELFARLLPQLSEMKTFVFSVGDIFKDENLLPTLYNLFPPNLSTLRFRGPTSLAGSSEWPNWVKSFASSGFLPNLKRLSFVLDLLYEAPEGESSCYESCGYHNKPVPTPEHTLRDAKDACKELYRAVEQRGVIVEPFQDKWSDRWAVIKQVDERWMQL